MFRRTTAILLALLVLLSSTGFSITAHLCHGQAVSYSLFGQPADCGTGEENAEEAHCDHEVISDTPETGCQTQECCTNESRFFKGIETVVLTAKPLAGISVFVLPAPAASLERGPLVFVSAITPAFANYHPPERTRDLPVWLRVFRI